MNYSAQDTRLFPHFVPFQEKQALQSSYRQMEGAPSADNLYAIVARATDMDLVRREVGLMTEMSREELIEKLQDVAGEMSEVMRSFGAHEPDWVPLEKALPLKWCAGFMFMGYHKGIRMYKHGFTRYYLFLDEDANAYSYDADTESYDPIPLPMAIEMVFDGLEEMGYKRSTPYDDAHIAEKNRRLAEAGWTVLTVDPSREDDANGVTP